MADTGPPFDLPYPLSTEVVRDGASRIQQLAEAVNAAIPGGIGTNVVVSTFDNQTSDASGTAVEGGSATITLNSAASKVLVLAHSERLEIVSGVDVAELRVARSSPFAVLARARWKQSAGGTNYGPGFLLALDAPNTVGTVTYSLSHVALDAGATLRRIGAGSLVLIEVAA